MLRGAYHRLVPSTATDTQTRPSQETETEQPSLWNVVLLNDEEHTYEYVVEMMQKVFGHPKEKGYQIAKAVDSDGRAVCLTTHKEHAELKRDQIHGFGKDWRMEVSKGSMSAVIEPAEFDGEEED